MWQWMEWDRNPTGRLCCLLQTATDTVEDREVDVGLDKEEMMEVDIEDTVEGMDVDEEDDIEEMDIDVEDEIEEMEVDEKDEEEPMVLG